MTCDTARLLLAFRRPGGPHEIGAADAAALANHLAGCAGCSAASARQKSFDAALATAMRAVPVPADLRDRLVSDALARRGADLRQRTYRSLAFAAALLVAVGLGVGLDRAMRPTVDTDSFAFAASQTLADPEPAVGRWLTDQGLPDRLPLDFNYGHYVVHGKGELAGREAPMVVFQARRPGDDQVYSARVYVLRESRFDMRGLKDAQESFCNVMVVRDEGDARGLAYVILYTSPMLDPFLKPQTRQLTRADRGSRSVPIRRLAV